MCNSPPPGAVGPGSRCVPKLESSWLPITLSQGISSRFVRYEAVQLLEVPAPMTPRVWMNSSCTGSLSKEGMRSSASLLLRLNSLTSRCRSCTSEDQAKRSSTGWLTQAACPASRETGWAEDPRKRGREGSKRKRERRDRSETDRSIPVTDREVRFPIRNGYVSGSSFHAPGGASYSVNGAPGSAAGTSSALPTGRGGP